MNSILTGARVTIDTEVLIIQVILLFRATNRGMLNLTLLGKALPALFFLYLFVSDNTAATVGACQCVTFACDNWPRLGEFVGKNALTVDVNAAALLGWLSRLEIIRMPSGQLQVVNVA